MATTPPATSEAMNSTDVRLTLRGLFVVTMIVAVLAGTTGIVLRKQRSIESLPVAAFWLGIVTGIVAGTSLAVWRRRWVERRAGRVVARGRLAHIPWPRLSRFFEVPLSVLGFAYLLVATIAVCAAFASGFLGTSAWIPFVAGFLGWTFIAGGAAAETWRRSIRICDDGVVHTDLLLRWSRVRNYYWHHQDEDLLVLCLLLRRLAVKVRPQDRPAVEALLKDKVNR